MIAPPCAGMARGLLFCWVTEHAITLVAIDHTRHPFVFTDDAIASFVRLCAILAVRLLWGALSLYRALEDELGGKTYDWDHWCKENPELKIAMAMLPMVATRTEADHIEGGVAEMALCSGSKQ
jgi:hypothetical protein